MSRLFGASFDASFVRCLVCLFEALSKLVDTEDFTTYMSAHIESDADASMFVGLKRALSELLEDDDLRPSLRPLKMTIQVRGGVFLARAATAGGGCLPAGRPASRPAVADRTAREMRSAARTVRLRVLSGVIVQRWRRCRLTFGRDIYIYIYIYIYIVYI